MNMKLRVLITGKNRKIASDVYDHLFTDRDYRLIKAPSSKNALFEMMMEEMPHVVMICLGNETKESIKIFDILTECTRTGNVEIIVVANEDDKSLFIANTRLERMFFLSRPVSLSALYRKLEEFEDAIDESDFGDGSIEEYINTNVQREFERKHILVVDDDPEQLMAIKEHLREFYEVSLLNGGKSVIKFLQKFKVDLILLDYMMPEMDGPGVLVSLKAYPEFRDIPVVFLTGVSDKKVVMKTIKELKPAGYVLKPTKKSEIVAKIIDVLG
ncbi:MAG: response regulator [Lachnospiraceae bacterium]|nr:response regulator [Lachnospiraceae bacterium]